MKLAVLLLAAAALLPAQPDRFGLPACLGPSAELADRVYFVLCHDSALLVPRWTAHEIGPERLGGDAPRPRRFRSDAELSGPAAIDADYRASGYTRGHMVPAEDMAFSHESIRATFLLSNAAPQLLSVNNGKWRKLENAIRSIAAASEVAYVVTGSIFASRPANFAGAVAVPTHFFKVALAVRGGESAMYAAIVPNAAVSADSLNQFAVSVAEVERRTGLDFFSALDDELEQRLESTAEIFPFRERRK